MKAIATLCLVEEGDAQKIIALSPKSDAWFVNRDDLPEVYRELVAETEKSGTVAVLGMMFGPGEEGS